MLDVNVAHSGGHLNRMEPTAMPVPNRPGLARGEEAGQNRYLVIAPGTAAPLGAPVQIQANCRWRFDFSRSSQIKFSSASERAPGRGPWTR